MAYVDIPSPRKAAVKSRLRCPHCRSRKGPFYTREHSATARTCGRCWRGFHVARPVASKERNNP
jgi:hypothetical protein